MARQIINTGTAANDGTGDTLRIAGGKINANFAEVYELLGGDSAAIGTNVTLTDSGIDFPGTNYLTKLGFNEGTANVLISLPSSSGEVIVNTATQTLYDKTLNQPILDSATLVNLSLKRTSAGSQYDVIIPSLASSVNLNLPNLTDSDTLAVTDAAQTLDNKTINNSVINSPRITSHIYDVNGAEIFELSAVSSAVNHFDIANATAGNPPIFQAHGTDSDISIDLKGRNRGAVIIEKIAMGQTTQTTDGTLSRKTTHISCNKGSTLNVTLANGTEPGEMKIITNKGSGNAIVTPGSFTPGSTSVTIQQYGAATLIWDGTYWFVTGYSSDSLVTIS